jgi:cytochrome c
MKFTMIAAGAAVLTAVATPSLAQDAAAGATVFRQCQACHVIDQEQNRVGPHLVGIVGRPVASVEGFNYSDAMRAYGEGKVWDAETLATYLADPRGVVEGTRMAYAGVKDPDQLANLIAYLENPTQ